MPTEVIAPMCPYRAEWLWVGLGLALLGLALGYSLVEKVRDIEAVEGDRLQVQARLVDHSLGLQIQAIDHALLDLREVLARPAGDPPAPAASRLMRHLGHLMPGVLSMVHVDAGGKPGFCLDSDSSPWRCSSLQSCRCARLATPTTASASL